MSNETSSTRLESGKDNARINILVEQLKSKLKNFAVVDRQGELMGEVKDVTLDTNRQLTLVVSQRTTEPRSRLFLLMSKLIQKIDAQNKSVLIDINKAEVEHLPEYVTTETLSMESEVPSPVTPALEVADGTTKDSDRSNPTVMPIPVEDIQEALDKDNALESSNTPNVLAEEIIRLLGERVVVNRSKRKVGEVIVRKEVETRIVQIQVPVRHEKLIVEQVSPERKQLAEIDLGQEEVTGIELTQREITGIDLPENASLDLEIASLDNEPTVRVVNSSPERSDDRI